MASLKVGHVYVIHTTLTKPLPKDKLVVCVGISPDLFVWFNTNAQIHGQGQLACTPGDHAGALTHACYLDLSRVTTFPAREIDQAQDRGPISDSFKAKILAAVQAGNDVLLPHYAKLILANLT